MPFKSEKQRRFLHANHPEVAKDWEEKYEDNEEDYERFEDPYDDYVDDDAREQARRDDELMGDIKVDTDSIPKRPDLKKGMKDLDDKIKQMQFKNFYRKRNG
jgi:hypothetical protein|tara:strand:- start:2327 stop:2632 length:306 start_codon:yes stop_codon:yes gene_type:complete